MAPSWYDPAQVKTLFMDSLVMDFLRPLNARVGAATKSDLDRVVLVGNTRRKEILKKKSGTRKDDGWRLTSRIGSTQLGAVCAMVAGLNCNFDGYHGIQSAYDAYRICVEHLARIEDDNPNDLDEFSMLAICMAIHDGVRQQSFDFKRWKQTSKLDFLESVERASQLLPNIDCPAAFRVSEAYFDLLISAISYWIPFVLAVDQSLKIESWLSREQTEIGVAGE